MKTLYTTKNEKGTYEHSKGIYAKVVQSCDELKLIRAGWVKDPSKLEVKKEKIDYKMLAEQYGIPTEVDGKPVHHKTLIKQVEEKLNASNEGAAS